ncbi:MAG TPA: sensor domain-containing diguanylate cyclase [Mycobacteriales bacterium]|nr:sensor domain-containing diguanylate cyclase [Mycobacteriales bacterium]
MQTSARRERAAGLARWARGPARWARGPGYRDHRSDVALEVVRVALVALSLVSLLSATALPDDVRTASISAHAGVALLSLTVVALLPAAARAGRAHVLGVLSTTTTLGFFVVTTALWHDVPGAESALGLLALLEAPLRWGWRGAALSGFPVLWTALLMPQVDDDGRVLARGVILALVALLLAAALTVREVMRRSLAAVAGAAQGFAEAMLHLPLGVAVLDEHGRVLQANPALSELLGPTAVGTALADQLEAPSAGLQHVLTGVAADDRVVCGTASGREVSVGAATVNVPGPQRTVVHVHDVTDERRERRDLLHASRHDALTGLLSRQAGGTLLTEAVSGATPAAVLFVDLDGFKSLNDTAGHAAGDVVLRQVAGRLAGALRDSEHAVRWGGDEFVVVCPAVADDAGLAAVAQRLLAVLREPFSVPGLPLIALTASVGAVLAPPHSLAPSVLGAADMAMYEAKRAGGDRWVTARPGGGPVPAQREPATITLPELAAR